MVKNGNFTLLLTSTGQGWEFNIFIVSYRQINWQIYPPRTDIYTGSTPSSTQIQQWQFNISIVSYRQINWQIYPPELTSSGQGWQLPDLLPDLTPNALWDIYYGMYLVAIWIL